MSKMRDILKECNYDLSIKRVWDIMKEYVNSNQNKFDYWKDRSPYVVLKVDLHRTWNIAEEMYGDTAPHLITDNLSEFRQWDFYFLYLPQNQKLFKIRDNFLLRQIEEIENSQAI
jgi:hypothetical protein